MIDTLDYEKVPAGFTHCFNGTCKLADTCLRYQAGRISPKPNEVSAHSILPTSKQKKAAPNS